MAAEELEVVYGGVAAKREIKSIVVERELERLYKRHNTITVDLLIEEAGKPKHPLHSYFDWDDSVAGPKWRKTQATALIMTSKFVVQLIQDGKASPAMVKEQGRVRKLINVYRGQGFKMRNEALGDAEMRAAVIEGKKGQLRSWCNNVIDIPELSDLRLAILAKL